MFVFSESCLSQKTFYCRKLIVFSCLQFADCYIWQRIFVLWCDFCVLITFTESFFWKVFLQEIMVLSKTCVRFRNRIFKRFEWVLIKLSFSLDCWVKDFVRHYGKSLKTFPFWALTFFLFRKVKLRNLEGWLFKSGPLERC